MPHLTLTQRIAAGCLGFLLSAPALAGDPITLHFQSRVTDAGGAPLTQTGLSVTTRLYSTALGGAPFWTETRMVDVQGGLVAFDLGDVTALDSELVAGPLPVFVGVTLGTDSEMVPRLRLNALPLAKHADTATSAVTAEAATTAVHATTADQALSADFATSAGNAASADFATTAASATSADDVPGKTINPKDIRIGGQYVIDKFGQWVGDPTGLQGPVGPEGPQGVPGVPGAQGVPGPQGPAGDSQFDAIGTGTVRFVGSAFAAALQLAPDAALGGGNSLIYFAEDASATDGTLVMHDGAADELRFWGLDGGVISGPHLAVDTQGGQVGIGTTPGFARLTLSAPAGTAALETVAGTNTRVQVNGLGGVSLGGPGPSVPGGSVFVNGQLGIGDSTPDAALDVVGDVLVSGDVTAATATRWANVTPASFVLVQGAAYEQNVTAANDLVIYANSATNVSFCDLDLPHGATIERLRWTGIDALSFQDSMLELQRIRRTSGAIDVLLQTPTVGNSVLLRTFQTPFVSSEVVDNDQYAYRLRLVLGASGSAGNVLHSAQVEYTTPSSLR